MYNPQETYRRIKNLSKERKIPISTINEYATLGENTIAESGNGTDGMRARNLCAIAECLDCSIDYLLGLTDNPTAHKKDNGIVDNVGSTINGIAPLSENAATMLEIFSTLDTMSQAELLVYANKLKNGKGA